jgi:uncharacterized protein
VRLDALAHRFPAGHRLRLGISTSYWPWAWPSPEPPTVTLHGGHLLLPVRRDRNGPESPPFGPPEWAQPLAVEVLQAGRTSREHNHDPESSAHEIAFEWDVGGRRRLAEAGTEMDDTNHTSYRIVDATEEAVLNALWRAERTEGREGRVAERLPHADVLELLERHGRIGSQ